MWQIYLVGIILRKLKIVSGLTFASTLCIMCSKMSKKAYIVTWEDDLN